MEISKGANLEIAPFRSQSSESEYGRTAVRPYCTAVHYTSISRRGAGHLKQTFDRLPHTGHVGAFTERHAPPFLTLVAVFAFSRSLSLSLSRLLRQSRDCTRPPLPPRSPSVQLSPPLSRTQRALGRWSGPSAEFIPRRGAARQAA